MDDMTQYTDDILLHKIKKANLPTVVSGNHIYFVQGTDGKYEIYINDNSGVLQLCSGGSSSSSSSEITSTLETRLNTIEANIISNTQNIASLEEKLMELESEISGITADYYTKAEVDQQIKNVYATIQNTSSSTTAVTGIKISNSTLSLVVGGTGTLTADVVPSDATNQLVEWSSNNTSVATVSGGVVVAKSAGSATISAKSSDGGFTTQCNVTVAAKQVTETALLPNTSSVDGLQTGVAENFLISTNPIASGKTVTKVVIRTRVTPGPFYVYFFTKTNDSNYVLYSKVGVTSTAKGWQTIALASPISLGKICYAAVSPEVLGVDYRAGNATTVQCIRIPTTALSSSTAIGKSINVSSYTVSKTSVGFYLLGY